MLKNKINKLLEKINEIKNYITIPLISDFLYWFLETIEIHFNKQSPNLKFNKGDIYFVNLGKNIGSELSKIRPCIIYSVKKANFGETIIILPLKSYNGRKLIKDFQIILHPTKENKLQKDSICDLSSIRQVSKKRVLDKRGKIELEYLENIDSKILNIFGNKKIKSKILTLYFNSLQEKICSPKVKSLIVLKL